MRGYQAGWHRRAAHQNRIELVEGDPKVRGGARKQETVREEDELVHGSGPEGAGHGYDKDDAVDACAATGWLDSTSPNTEGQHSPYNTASQAKPMREARSSVRIMVGGDLRELDTEPRLYEAPRQGWFPAQHVNRNKVTYRPGADCRHSLMRERRRRRRPVCHGSA